MGRNYLSRSLMLLSICMFVSCDFKKKAKSDIEIEFTQDTLEVGYTYWWDESGPFIGYCGEEYALAFAGTVTHLAEPSDNAAPLYTSQKGIIELETVFKINNPESNVYANQKFFVSDCFYDLELAVGDKVLVFCYSYEGNFSIPGRHSILKIGSIDHPLVASTKAYIDADQNALEIKKDTTLWSAYGFGDRLAQHIRCAEDAQSMIIP